MDFQECRDIPAATQAPEMVRNRLGLATACTHNYWTSMPLDSPTCTY